MNKFTNPSGLRATENNKKKIYELSKGKLINAKELSELMGISYSRASVLCSYLVASEHLEYVDMVVPQASGNKRRCRYFKATAKEYIPTEYITEETKRKYEAKRPTQYYGNGKVFNPWEPKLPEGMERTVRLFNDKDHDYFRQPLKKAKRVSIGSTFSLYDGAGL